MLQQALRVLRKALVIGESQQPKMLNPQVDEQKAELKTEHDEQCGRYREHIPNEQNISELIANAVGSSISKQFAQTTNTAEIEEAIEDMRSLCNNLVTKIEAKPRSQFVGVSLHWIFRIMTVIFITTLFMTPDPASSAGALSLHNALHKTNNVGSPFINDTVGVSVYKLINNLPSKMLGLDPGWCICAEVNCMCRRGEEEDLFGIHMECEVLQDKEGVQMMAGMPEID